MSDDVLWIKEYNFPGKGMARTNIPPHPFVPRDVKGCGQRIGSKSAIIAHCALPADVHPASAASPGTEGR
jgi:hypothetical protein